MKFVRNFRKALARPLLARDYFVYQLSRLQNGGKAVRYFREDKLKIGGFSGFSEFHSCARFINVSERHFLTEYPFGVGSIIDVGANLGVVSLVLARRFPESDVHSFEPNPTTFEAMRANFSRNERTNIQAYGQAVTDREGEIAFEADTVNRATTHIAGSGHIGVHGRSIINVPCVTLDNFVERQCLQKISLLKVDVEGYEELVFRGAERLMGDGQASTIYYEVCPDLTRRAGFTPEAASERLLAHGYRLHRLHEDGELRPVDIGRIANIELENWVATKGKRKQ